MRKATPKTRKPVAAAKTAKAPRENLCVFAFRLPPEEREAIHKAAQNEAVGATLTIRPR